MKLRSTLLFLLLATNNLFTQTCLPEGLILWGQVGIDLFPSNYPGCSVILGDIIIEEMDTDISNLDSLIYLTEVQGNVIIGGEYGTPYLGSLEGFENLTAIGGDFEISGNFDLYSLTGLENLTSIAGQLFINGNPYLSNLAGLDNLDSVGSITIQSNNNLTSLTGIDSVDYTTLSSLTINYNDELTWCSIYSVCNYINSEDPNVTISYNNTGCGNQPQVEEMCITGINNKRNDKNFVISPNPVKNKLAFSSVGPEKERYSLRILNLSGKEVFSQSSLQENSLIDVSELKGGMYILQVEFENGYRSSRKFVKE